MEYTAAIIAGVVAVIAGVVAGAVSAGTAVVSWYIAERRALIEEKLATFERELAGQRAQLSDRSVFAVERTAHEYMLDAKSRWRSFKAIKHHFSGFEEDELRKILVSAGAIRFDSHSGDEVWGLLKRNLEWIGVEKLPEGLE